MFFIHRVSQRNDRNAIKYYVLKFVCTVDNIKITTVLFTTVYQVITCTNTECNLYQVSKFQNQEVNKGFVFNNMLYTL